MKIPSGSRLVSSIPGCTARKYVVPGASMTSQLVQTRAAVLLDLVPNLDGIPFVPPHWFLVNFVVGLFGAS